MITLLAGENNYGIEQALDRIKASFDGEPEKFDGDGLELRQLPDMLSGQSLFAQKRLIVIRGLSDNKQLWEVLPDFVPRMSDDTHLVLIEPSPDKRTKTYKALQKAAEVKNFPLLTERDGKEAERWLLGEAKDLGVSLNVAAARELLQRSHGISTKGQPVIDQWQAKHALEKVSVFDNVTAEIVRQYVDQQPAHTVFGIFETALKGDAAGLHRLLGELERREDPYRVFGLLSGQVFQLAALAVSDLPAVEVAKAIGAHPFAVGKLAASAKKLGSRKVAGIVTAFTEADEDMKLSKAEPWVLVERALMKTVQLVKST